MFKIFNVESGDNIFPIDFTNSHEFDIQNNPQKYFKSMIYMCLEIEKINTASYQFFPLRTDIIPKYIPIDTKSLIEIYIRENKNELLNNIEDNQRMKMIVAKELGEIKSLQAIQPLVSAFDDNNDKYNKQEKEINNEIIFKYKTFYKAIIYLILFFQNQGLQLQKLLQIQQNFL
jgi:hypothetical protein